MITYKVGDETFGLSYEDLKQSHYSYTQMTDKKFRKEIIQATHLACIIAYLKEMDIESTVGDRGVIHEMIHLASIPRYHIKPVREKFNTLLKLD